MNAGSIDYVFGWHGYNDSEKEFLIKKFLNKENLTISEVISEIKNSL